MNVLLITTDQQRADTLGCAGNPLDATPRVDALAREGTRYTAARTQNPLCQPARATILTGTYPSTHGVTCNGVDLPADGVDRSLATLLGAAGYRTAIIGKAHFATTFPYYPTGKVESVEGSARVRDDWYGPYAGFDHAELILFGHNLRIADLMGHWSWAFGPPPFGLHYARFLFRDGAEKGYERLRLMQPEAAGVEWDHTQTWANALPEEDHPTTWIADRAIEWLRAVDEPFFAWVSFTDPHHPMDPPAPWSSRYDPADVLEVLPEIHPDEHATKPPIHSTLASGLRGRALEWANPGGATLTREELAKMTAGYYAMVAAAGPRDRPCARRARGARRRRRDARHRHDRPRRVPRRAPDDLQGAVRVRQSLEGCRSSCAGPASLRVRSSTTRSAPSTSRRPP
ncbi:MAG: hypothetical protein KatS3mg010_1551 [Acidimicrobiia bacterium]|nr:MAG: hypothetical protein KatS3mg010_1551 [Acidimicrobiia bacterium]